MDREAGGGDAFDGAGDAVAGGVVVAEARARLGEVRVERQPGRRREDVGPLEAEAPARPAGLGGARVADEEQLGVDVQAPDAPARPGSPRRPACARPAPRRGRARSGPPGRPARRCADRGSARRRARRCCGSRGPSSRRPRCSPRAPAPGPASGWPARRCARRSSPGSSLRTSKPYRSPRSPAIVRSLVVHCVLVWKKSGAAALVHVVLADRLQALAGPRVVEARRWGCGRSGPAARRRSRCRARTSA